MAPLVREVMVGYQRVIATHNDLGQLASMQNKFVRIALERLRLSIKEFVDELPPQMDQAYAAAISPEGANPPRVFIPTRPSLLNSGESLRIFIVAPGLAQGGEVKLFTSSQGARQWHSFTAGHNGRDVYAVQLGPFAPGVGTDRTIEYYATARSGAETFCDPPQAPENVYILNIVS